MNAGAAYPIVDSQIHIWGADTPQRPWPHRVRAHREVPFSAADAVREMDAAGVQRAVLVPPWWEGERNDLASDAVRMHPDRFGVMGLLVADAPDAPERLAAWRSTPGMLGIRFSSQDPKYRTAFAEGRVDWIWGVAEKAGVPVMMSVHPTELPRVQHVARRHPELRVAIDHMARDIGKLDAAAFPCMPQLLALARLPNVAVKASGLPAYTSEPYPCPLMQSYAREVFEAFGPRRFFWGSDLTKLPCTYRQAITLFTEAIDWIPAEDKPWVMGRGLREWLHWNDPEVPAPR